jgi:hypothetical protein
LSSASAVATHGAEKVPQLPFPEMAAGRVVFIGNRIYARLQRITFHRRTLFIRGQSG